MVALSPRRSPALGPEGDLIAHLQPSGQPAVIDYTAERVELSGRVLVNWATKFTHLLDLNGITDADDVLLDLPCSWLSTGLALGAHWVTPEITFLTDDADSAAIVTDRPEHWANSSAELFVVGESADPSVVLIEEDILAQPDQALLPVPSLVPTTPLDHTESNGSYRIYDHGLLIAAAPEHTRLNSELWELIRAHFAKLAPVIFVDAVSLNGDLNTEVQDIIRAERL